MGLLPPLGKVSSASCSKAGHFTSLVFWKCFLLKHNSLSTCYFHHFWLVLVYSFNKYYLVPTVVSGEVLGIGDKKMKMLASLSEDISSEVLAEHGVNYNHELGELCQNQCMCYVSQAQKGSMDSPARTRERGGLWRMRIRISGRKAKKTSRLISFIPISETSPPCLPIRYTTTLCSL